MNTKELRAMLEKATPGEWSYAVRTGDDIAPASIGVGRNGIRSAVAMCPRYARGQFANDAALIVSLRNAAPLLLDVVEAAENFCDARSATSTGTAMLNMEAAVLAYRAAKE